MDDDLRHELNKRVRFFGREVEKAHEARAKAVSRDNRSQLRKAERRMLLAEAIEADYKWIRGDYQQPSSISTEEKIAWLSTQYSDLCEFRAKLEAKGKLENPGGLDYNLAQLGNAANDYKSGRMSGPWTE